MNKLIVRYKDITFLFYYQIFFQLFFENLFESFFFQSFPLYRHKYTTTFYSTQIYFRYNSNIFNLFLPNKIGPESGLGYAGTGILGKKQRVGTTPPFYQTQTTTMKCVIYIIKYTKLTSICQVVCQLNKSELRIRFLYLPLYYNPIHLIKPFQHLSLIQSVVPLLHP